MQSLRILRNQDGLTTSEKELLDIARRDASWIWIREENHSAPDSPQFEQRAFRVVYRPPGTRGKPVNTTIMVAADDFYAMYINGVQVMPLDPRHDWTTIVAFNIPLPVVQNDTSSNAIVLGFRVLNTLGRAGLLVAAEVNFDDSLPPERFYTGKDENWRGEKTFEEGWEQPSFDPRGQLYSKWDPAVIYPNNVRSPAEPTMAREQVAVFEAAAAGPTAVLNVPDNPESSEGSGSGISGGVFGGSIAGVAVISFILGALGAYFLVRRHFKRKAVGVLYGDVTDVEVHQFIPVPDTTPGRRAYLDI